MQQDRRPVVQGVGQWVRRMYPFQPVAPQGQAEEEGRGSSQGMDGSADVVHESRQGELSRASAATEGVPGLKQQYCEPGLGKRNGGGESVWS